MNERKEESREREDRERESKVDVRDVTLLIFQSALVFECMSISLFLV